MQHSVGDGGEFEYKVKVKEKMNSTTRWWNRSQQAWTEVEGGRWQLLCVFLLVFYVCLRFYVCVVCKCVLVFCLSLFVSVNQINVSLFYFLCVLMCVFACMLFPVKCECECVLSNYLCVCFFCVHECLHACMFVCVCFCVRCLLFVCVFSVFVSISSSLTFYNLFFVYNSFVFDWFSLSSYWYWVAESLFLCNFKMYVRIIPLFVLRSATKFVYVYKQHGFF